jgi:hypothetical protein
MSEITFGGNKMLKTIAREWSTKYPYLYLRFFTPEGGNVSDWKRTHSSVRAKKAAEELSTNARMNVGTFESRYELAYGARVEIMYVDQKGTKRSSIGENNKQTLKQYNEWAKAQGAVEILKTFSDWF